MTITTTAAGQQLFDQGMARLVLTAEEASVLHAALDASREFFRRPKHERERFASDDYNHGYRPLGKEYSITPERPDLNECFTLWSDRSDLIPNGDDAFELTQALMAWRSILLPKISAILGAVADRFDGSLPTCESASYMQVNHYGALGETERELLQDRHEDGHLITCLHATEEGLEAFVDGQAVPTRTADDEILLMAGSVLSQLTGGDIPPLYHQVRNHGVQNRLSLMYFVNPELGEPIPSWVDPSTDLRDAVRTNPSMFGLPDVPEL